MNHRVKKSSIPLGLNECTVHQCACAYADQAGQCKTPEDPCAPIVMSCEGCGRIRKEGEQQYCTAYTQPKWAWRRGECLLATHLDKKKQTETTMINPLKASRRAAKKH